jgi:hypothetical protein
MSIVSLTVVISLLNGFMESVAKREIRLVVERKIGVIGDNGDQQMYHDFLLQKSESNRLNPTRRILPVLGPMDDR